jgi:hypothetical protein
LRWLATAAAVAVPVAVGTSVYDPTGRLGDIARGAAETPQGTVYVQTTRFVSPPIDAFHWWFKGGRFSIGSDEAGGARGLSAVHDRGAGKYYGFEYAIHPRADGRFDIDVQPLSMAKLDRGPFAVSGTIVPLPEMPSRVTVADGDFTAVEVYRSGNEHLYVHLEISSRPFAGMFDEPPLGAQQLRLTQPRLTVNGAPSGSDRSTAQGGTVWVRIPGHRGRYLIALDPMGNPNFMPNGSVRGGTLEFQIGAERIRVDCARPIASHDAALYVYDDASFESSLKPGETGLMSGSAGPACYFNGACLQGK